MKKTLIIFIFIFFTSCNYQKQKNIEKSEVAVEKFDFELYKKSNFGSEKVMAKNGNLLSNFGFDDSIGGFQIETPLKPNFYTFYKEFYTNGNIKKVNKLFGGIVKIDTSEHYDEKGSLIKTEDENKKFGKIKPNDILLFLQKEGYINVKTGEGRENKDGSPKFETSFDNNIWYITIKQGRGITLADLAGSKSIGEPSEWFPFSYEIDGDTGKVLKTNKK